MYRYNKRVYFNLIIVAVIFIVLFFTDGIGIATGATLLVLALVAVLFRCYRIDVMDTELIIHQFYTKRMSFSWSEVQSIRIESRKTENKIMGASRNMIIAQKGKPDAKVNLEPVDNQELYDVLKIKCDENGIEYKLEK